MASPAATVYAWIAAVCAVILLGSVLAGCPPRHCRYLVPVASHPGVLSCSEHPQAKRSP